MIRKVLLLNCQEAMKLGLTFSVQGLDTLLNSLGAAAFFYDEEEANRFVRAAKENKKAAYEGMVVALEKDAEVIVDITDHDMLRQ